jgi:hypothetical protein
MEFPRMWNGIVSGNGMELALKTSDRKPMNLAVAWPFHLKLQTTF